MRAEPAGSSLLFFIALLPFAFLLAKELKKAGTAKDLHGEALVATGESIKQLDVRRLSG